MAQHIKKDALGNVRVLSEQEAEASMDRTMRFWSAAIVATALASYLVVHFGWPQTPLTKVALMACAIGGLVIGWRLAVWLWFLVFGAIALGVVALVVMWVLQ